MASHQRLYECGKGNMSARGLPNINISTTGCVVCNVNKLTGQTRADWSGQVTSACHPTPAGRPLASHALPSGTGELSYHRKM